MPGALDLFCLVSEPGRGAPDALLFFCLVSVPGFFLLLSKVGVSQVRNFFSLISEPVRSGPGALFYFCLVSCVRYAVCRLTVKNV